MLSNNFPQMSCMLEAFPWDICQITVTYPVRYRLQFARHKHEARIQQHKKSRLLAGGRSRIFSHPYHYHCRNAYNVVDMHIVITYALLYVYGWTDGQVSSFAKKQTKMKKGPFRTRAETTHVKMPQAGLK